MMVKRLIPVLISLSFLLTNIALVTADETPPKKKGLPKSQQIAPNLSQPLPPKSKISFPLTPVVHSFDPQRAHSGDLVSIVGLNFGTNTRNNLRIRIISRGYSQLLTVESWSPNLIRVRLPNNARTGTYYLGVTDTTGQWLSNNDKGLTILDPNKKLPVDVAVFVDCEKEIVNPPRNITMEVSGDNGPIRTILSFARQRPGPRGGSLIYDYTGQIDIRVGSYGASFPNAGIQYLSYSPISNPACLERNRVGLNGQRMNGVIIWESTTGIVVADKSTLLVVNAMIHPITSSGGSIASPPPICPTEDCK
jgi:hypothetical protein